MLGQKRHSIWATAVGLILVVLALTVTLETEARPQTTMQEPASPKVPAMTITPSAQSPAAQVSSPQTISSGVTGESVPGEIVPEQEGFVVDHTSVALFEQIPDEYLEAARNLRMLFSDRSVGQNINEALDCLTAASWGQSPATCRRDYTDANWEWKTFTEADRTNGLVPARILFDPDPIKYNRGNWTFEFKAGTWSELTQDFIQVLAPQYINNKDVLSYQFSYLNVEDSSDIADPENGFFADNPDRYDIHDLEAYIAQHPDKIFFFWTTSLARSIGTQASTDFNNQMRQYALANDKILFDVADILSHTDQGTPCYDNRDGIQYCTRNGACENHPDDGQNLPAICQDYTTEIDGGHLGSVSAAKIQVAKAFWVLMARIAGWDGNGSTLPTRTPTVTSTPTATTVANETATPTATSTPPGNATATATSTPTPTVAGTATATGTPTVTGTPTATSTPTHTPAVNVYVPAVSNETP